VFAAHKIREAELAALHAFDVRLVEEIPRLQILLKTVAEATGRDNGFADAVRAAEDGLRRLEETLDDRDRLARGL
jgi:alpha-ketoglutarate-dependent taurine dioxygenase